LIYQSNIRADSGICVARTVEQQAELAISAILDETTVTVNLTTSSRFFCPHCHASLDPAALDSAGNEHIDLRVCPECDAPVLLAESDCKAGNVTGEPIRGNEINRRMVLASMA
jgi:hypothetical protein